MALYMFDAAYKPNLATVRAKGGIAVNGYLTGSYQHSTTQARDARAAGLGYVPTYEEGPSELVGASQADGRAIGDRILAAFHEQQIPLTGQIAVYPSVDVSVASGDVRSIDAGYKGLRRELAGHISLRIYAEGALIDHAVKAALVDGKCWLAAPTSWPGYRADDANVCMVQEVGSSVAGTDRNHLITDPHAIGAWWPAGSPYSEDDVDEATMDKIAAKVWDHLIDAPESAAERKRLGYTRKSYPASSLLADTSWRARDTRLTVIAQANGVVNTLTRVVAKVIHNRDGKHPNALDELGPIIRKLGDK